MADLIPQSQKSTLKDAINSHWDTFKNYWSLTVMKEPIEKVTNLNSRTSSAFGRTEVNPSNVEYTYRSGVFDVIKVSASQDSDEQVIDELNISKADGDIAIKCKQNCKDFIEDGTNNEKATLNGETFNIKTDSLEKNFLGQKFYYFGLGRMGLGRTD